MLRNKPTATITTLRRKTGALLKQAETHPIRITRYGKPAFVLMSAEHYDLLSGSEAPAS